MILDVELHRVGRRLVCLVEGVSVGHTRDEARELRQPHPSHAAHLEHGYDRITVHDSSPLVDLLERRLVVEHDCCALHGRALDEAPDGT